MCQFGNILVKTMAIATSSSNSNRSSPLRYLQKGNETKGTRKIHVIFWEFFNEVAKYNSSDCRGQEKPNPIAI